MKKNPTLLQNMKTGLSLYFTDRLNNLSQSQLKDVSQVGNGMNKLLSKAGDLPAADVGGKKDYTNYDQKYAQRYNDFNSLIEILQSEHQCTLYESMTHELIKVGRSECHKIGDNIRRTIKFVHLVQKGKDFLLIELDTSDGIKSISTKLIHLTTDDWKFYLDDIKKHLVAKSLSWPNELFNDVFGENSHTYIIHPRFSVQENCSIESVNNWAMRIMNGLRDLT